MMSYGTPSNKLLRLTHEMLSVAEEGKWEEVGKIEMRRQLVLKELEAVLNMPGSATISDKQGIARDIQETLSLNIRLMDLGQHAKNDLAAAMGGLSQGRKAVKAYYGVQ